ncbi:unnamed protein product [Acanthoscelides obtectus]|uniref:Uncharacterized protein n=1 Tax=Acanthoscelides obtectus TaxID=200917 RepID=A0A9P0PXF0_ACAOB|nr:unnamed protein product [Acanthoscelides obtectus]CAH2006270.1 unnamed protein product [Acanthoscelides obtectus]CAK1634014.1 hypothetical protein AOBTE_LOCUS8537 [Acanthoscelides obtectus]CAK1634084.1 hypothetical protein AOBTE_LOCUS8594 [Acanthoscelides obtectus]
MSHLSYHKTYTLVTFKRFTRFCGYFNLGGFFDILIQYIEIFDIDISISAYRRYR